MYKIDNIDLKILSELFRDAGKSVPKISESINVNASVVYSRIKRLKKRGLLKRYTIEVNEELLGYSVVALVGINIDAKIRNDVINKLMALDGTKYISEVTGRFDLIISVIAKSLDDLHNMISVKIGKILGVIHSETFIELKKNINEKKYAINNTCKTSNE